MRRRKRKGLGFRKGRGGVQGLEREKEGWKRATDAQADAGDVDETHVCPLMRFICKRVRSSGGNDKGRRSQWRMRRRPINGTELRACALSPDLLRSKQRCEVSGLVLPKEGAALVGVGGLVGTLRRGAGHPVDWRCGRRLLAGDEMQEEEQKNGGGKLVHVAEMEGAGW